MMEMMKRHKEQIRIYRIKFQKVFGVPLARYFDLVLGFDIIKFDEDIIKSFELDGKSMSDVIKEKHGQEGVDIINALIGKNN